MHICGIIAEYNPFHLGHQTHIQMTREKTGADLIFCVMSGNFVQRGEPAIFDKWIRTRCAIACGADAVIELPLLYSVQSAEGFAAGGVAVLEAAGADFLSFGCETEDLVTLKKVAQYLSKESSDYKNLLRERLGEGLSFPKARMGAAFPDAADELIMPNAILGIEYIKAIHKSGSRLKPFAVKRVGQGYHSTDIGALLPSATAIRKALARQRYEEAYLAMPGICSDIVKQSFADGFIPVTADLFDWALMYVLRREGVGYIKTLQDVTEGLENRIYKAAGTADCRDGLIMDIKTKRYTYTRISRILLYALLGITKEMVEKQNKEGLCHLRVLGVKNKNVLSVLSKISRVPLVCGSAASSLYPSFDVTASDIYALSQAASPFCNVKRDFTEKLIIGS
jgi:predicted nucleotidyltransferase